MAMRRPRIKAAANLMNIKRKKTLDQDDTQAKNVKKIAEDCTNGISKEEHQIKENSSMICKVSTEEAVTRNNSNDAEGESLATDVFDSVHIQQESSKTLDPNQIELVRESREPRTSDDVLAINDPYESRPDPASNESATPRNTFDTSFKFPPKVDYNRSVSQHTIPGTPEEALQTNMEVNVIQMDLQKSVNGYPMSPSKSQSRQRIRPTPIFGQRRNSFVASSPSPHTGDDSMGSGATPEFTASSQRRERHYSGSLTQNSSAPSSSPYHYHMPHKFTPTMGMGRVRTESGCSAFSDSYANSGKIRKTDEHNHRNLTRRDFEARFTKGVPDKATLKMSDLIYYNPATNPMEQKPNIANIKRESSKTEDVAAATQGLDTKAASEQTETPEPTTAAIPVPQLKLNSNGELILDDKSLEIETTAEQEARKVLANSSLIFLDENTGMNGFYKRQKRTKEWLPEETIKFYRCLQTVGTDFSLMCQLFPKRTRRDLKLKFKKEERCNGALINKALLYPKNFNIEELKEQLDAEEQEREETERKWKEIKAKEAKLSKKVNVKTSYAARVLTSGDDIYQNEHVTKRKFSKRAQAAAECKKSDETKSTETTAHTQQTGKKLKPRAKRTTALKSPNAENVHNGSAAPSVPIKLELIKSEQIKSYVDNTDVQPVNLIDAVQLENQLSELLHTDAMDQKRSDTIIPDIEPQSTAEYETVDACHNKTLVNLDDGTVTYFDDLDTTTPKDTEIPSPQMLPEPDAPGSPCLRRDLDETDIQQILTELAEGSLVLVSTLDPDNADKVVNEIYLVNKDTGELYDEPLDIPEAIVQGILSVMS